MTVLIAGKHGGNVDTMILAQVNTVKKQITMLSIPRDIFFNSRKINSAYYHYGIDELKRELAFISGYSIDHYVLIDMYAFMDMIDILGGIVVYLDETLTDPTYKTFDYGEWGTLHYPKGYHYLSGKQVLRVARSRHYSSDYSRAKRQQSILLGIKNKFKKLGVGDIGKISRIIQIGLKKIKTDMSLNEILAYYLRFKDFEIHKGNVLSTGNVLKYKFQTLPEPDEESDKCYKQIPGTEKVIEIKCAAQIPGQYLLVPLKDWNTVRWYVRNIFEN